MLHEGEDEELIDMWRRIVQTDFSYDDASIQFVEAVIRGIRRPAGKHVY